MEAPSRRSYAGVFVTVRRAKMPVRSHYRLVQTFDVGHAPRVGRRLSTRQRGSRGAPCERYGFLVVMSGSCGELRSATIRRVMTTGAGERPLAGTRLSDHELVPEERRQHCSIPIHHVITHLVVWATSGQHLEYPARPRMHPNAPLSHIEDVPVPLIGCIR